VKRFLTKRAVAPEAISASQNSKRILLGQLGSNGDCLYATTIARQIKNDYPGCHLTWAIGSMYRSILDGNPYVDEVWEIPLSNNGDMEDVWLRFEREALERKKRGDLDEIFFTQIAPSNLHNYDGTIRSSIFRAYPHPITVPVTPVLRLSATEIENVRLFAESHRLADKANVILFECSPKSGQSFVTPDFAIEVAEKLMTKIPDVCVILSSNLSVRSTDERIIDGSVLSFRENAELTKYCTLLVGCSSGISWLCTSDWARPLPMIQLINSNAFWFASVAYDFEYWGLATNSVIEMSDDSTAKLLDCIEVAVTEGFGIARSNYHEKLQLKFDSFGDLLFNFLLHKEFRKVIKLVQAHFSRHGLNWNLFKWCFPKLLVYSMKKILRRCYRKSR